MPDDLCGVQHPSEPSVVCGKTSGHTDSVHKGYKFDGNGNPIGVFRWE
jgi:hypothetical protein